MVQSEEVFINAFENLQSQVYKNNVEKGFHDYPLDSCRSIVLMHCELSEAVEALRLDNPVSDKIPHSQVEEELADVIIRIMDYAAASGYSVARAIVDKIAYNKTRPFMHGNKKF